MYMYHKSAITSSLNLVRPGVSFLTILLIDIGLCIRLYTNLVFLVTSEMKVT